MFFASSGCSNNFYVVFVNNQTLFPLSTRCFWQMRLAALRRCVMYFEIQRKIISKSIFKDDFVNTSRHDSKDKAAACKWVLKEVRQILKS
ncbi:hypothetical protein PVAP13_8KG252002 [Panicum virgatum]|uniref:Uncharacterized protein n=1 Tax=Panicum virgatum TaxID=38727 RepID=A0A8T0PKB7_PANVG|nr:hypothetical protein PVAP13_8KG252002 [Panicum virgatum]